MIKIKRLMVCLLLPLCTMGLSMAQERINEFVVSVDENHNPMTIYSSYGATPNDGVVVINSRIHDLEFGILSVAKERLRKVVQDKGNNRYLLIIQPNDDNYKRYTITMKASGFMQGRIESVVVKAGLSSGYIVNPKEDAKVYRIGDDACPFLGYSGFKIAFLDKTGKHGFAIKYDEYGDFTSDVSFFPSITELRMMYDNRYVLGLTGEYWSSTLEKKRTFSGDFYKTFNFSTGETKIKKYGEISVTGCLLGDFNKCWPCLLSAKKFIKNDMNKRLLLFLFLLQSVVVAFSQERINEFVVKVDENRNPLTIYSSYGATPNDGVVVINSTIQDLEFNIPAAPGRIKTMADKNKNRYILIIQPNDNNYKQYTITINAKGFLQGKIDSVVVKAGLSTSYIVNPKYVVNVRCCVGDDAKDFIGYSGFKIAYIDASGKHGFAIKEDGESIATDTYNAPSIDELRIIYSNRYSLGLSGEYWSKTDANNLNRRYTIDFSTGETYKRKHGSYWKYKNIKIKRF